MKVHHTPPLGFIVPSSRISSGLLLSTSNLKRWINLDIITFISIWNKLIIHKIAFYHSYHHHHHHHHLYFHNHHHRHHHHHPYHHHYCCKINIIHNNIYIWDFTYYIKTVMQLGVIINKLTLLTLQSLKVNKINMVFSVPWQNSGQCSSCEKW